MYLTPHLLHLVFSPFKIGSHEFHLSFIKFIRTIVIRCTVYIVDEIFNEIENVSSVFFDRVFRVLGFKSGT